MLKKRKAERSELYERDSYETLCAVIAANIRKARKSKGWSQEEAAHQSDMSTRLLQSLEAGTTNATLVTIARLCDGLEINPIDLVRPPRKPRKRA